MYKQNLLILTLALSITSAQSQSTSTSVQFKDKMQSALVLDIPNTAKDVEGTILEKLKQTGYNPETRGALFWKKNTKEGFYIFNDVSLPNVSARKLDMYFKTVRKNKEEKNSSTVYLMIGLGNDYFASPEKDSLIWSQSQLFLDGFLDKSAAYSLEKEITKEEEALNDSRKKLSKLQEDEKDMNEKIKKYQKDIETSRADQENQQAEIETRAKSVEALKLKRK